MRAHDFRVCRALVLFALTVSCGRTPASEDSARSADAAAGETTPRALTQAEAEFADGFTFIDAIHEMPDGRVLVVDSREKSVRLVDLNTGYSERIGRSGRGPGEYSLPVALVTLGGDGVGVVDAASRRILTVRPDGTTGGIIRLQPPTEVGDDGAETWLRGGDRLGRLYATGVVYQTVNGQLIRRDSVPILRWIPGQAVADTVAWLRQQGTTVNGTQGAGRQEISIGINPFAGQDQWALAADGQVAIADPENYRIRWTDSTGSSTVLPAIPFTRLRLTDAHKEEYRAGQRRGVSVMQNDDDGTVVTRPHTGRISDPPWPEFLPPFLGRALIFAPDGRLWVQRTGPAGAAAAFDVVRRDGLIAARIVLPERTRLLGFGVDGTLYVARLGDDDLEHLQRYRIK